MEDKKIYIGIELDIVNDRVSASYTMDSEESPKTITIIGREDELYMPLTATLDTGTGLWSFADTQYYHGNNRVDRLFDRALAREKFSFENTSYAATRILAMYLEEIVRLAINASGNGRPACLVICMNHLDSDAVEVLGEVVELIKYKTMEVHFCDLKEAFFFFGMHQAEELKRHNIALFEHNDDKMIFYNLERALGSKPQKYVVNREKFFIADTNKDDSFTTIIGKCFGKEIYDAVFLIGDGFEGDWMSVSLAKLCQGRRVFLGKNLYSRGACFAAIDMSSPWMKNYSYVGEHEMKFSISIKVYEKGNISFYSICSAGTPWFEAGSENEVIIEKEPVIEFWVQLPESREARIESVELRELPERESRTTRIKIEAKPISDRAVKIRLEDVGLGEIIPGTHQKWEHIINL